MKYPFEDMYDFERWSTNLLIFISFLFFSGIFLIYVDFENPLSDLHMIKERQNAIQFFIDNKEIAKELAPDPLNVDRLILNRLFHQPPDFPNQEN